MSGGVGEEACFGGFEKKRVGAFDVWGLEVAFLDVGVGGGGGGGGAGEVTGDAAVALEYGDGDKELIEGDDEEEVGDQERMDATEADTAEKPHGDDENDGSDDGYGPEVRARGEVPGEEVCGEHEPEEEGEVEGVDGVELSSARADATPDGVGCEGGGEDDEEDQQSPPAIEEESGDGGEACAKHECDVEAGDADATAEREGGCGAEFRAVAGVE